MIVRKSITLLFTVLVCLAIPLQAAVVSYEITGYVDPFALKGAGGPIFNTSTDVPGSGTTANFLSPAINSYVDFTIGDLDNPGAGTVAHLRVIIKALSAGTQAMLARTSNSQGLTDDGTLTFLIGKNGSSGVHSSTLEFNWYEPDGTFLNPLANQYTITTFDIDFNQYNEMPSSQIAETYLADTYDASATTNLAVTPNGSFTRVSDPGGTNATFSDPENAAVFRTVEGSSQEIRVAKLGNASGNQLYMFEFQSPPSNVTITVASIPEPSTFLITLTGAASLLLRRRRS